VGHSADEGARPVGRAGGRQRGRRSRGRSRRGVGLGGLSLFGNGAISPEDVCTFELIPQEIVGLPAETAIGTEELDLSETQDACRWSTTSRLVDRSGLEFVLRISEGKNNARPILFYDRTLCRFSKH
jgi:hypothetical protein